MSDNYSSPRASCLINRQARRSGDSMEQPSSSTITAGGESQSTMSTLTTAASVRHDNAVEELNFDHDPHEEEEELPPLQNIWRCAFIERQTNGKVRKCLWCNEVFTPVHATCALSHVLSMKLQGIKVCKAIIPEKYLL